MPGTNKAKVNQGQIFLELKTRHGRVLGLLIIASLIARE